MIKKIITILISLSLTITAKDQANFIKELEAGKKQTIVTFGTSLTKVGAWVDQLRVSLEQAYPGQATVINGAQGGANSDWGKTVLKENVLLHKPDTVFIEFAINDSVRKRKTSVEHTKGNLIHFIDSIQKQNPNCEIILQVMNVCLGDTRTDRPNLDAYNQMYRDVAKDRELQLIDHWPNWQKLLQTEPLTFLRYMPDAIHPIREGALHIITPHLFAEIGLTRTVDPTKSEATPMWQYFFHLTRDRETQATTKATNDKFWTGFFTRSDLDQNKSLDAREIQSESLFKAMDTDNNAKVDLNEWLHAYNDIFMKLDRDNDGKVTREEQAQLSHSQK